MCPGRHSTPQSSSAGARLGALLLPTSPHPQPLLTHAHIAACPANESGLSLQLPFRPRHRLQPANLSSQKNRALCSLFNLVDFVTCFPGIYTKTETMSTPRNCQH